MSVCLSAILSSVGLFDGLSVRLSVCLSDCLWYLANPRHGRDTCFTVFILDCIFAEEEIDVLIDVEGFHKLSRFNKNENIF